MANRATVVMDGQSMPIALSPADFEVSGGYVTLNKTYGGYFNNTSSLTSSNATSSYVIPFPNTIISDGVSITSGSRITVDTAGTYNLQWSAQLINTDTSSEHNISMWVAVTGSSLSDSRSRVTIPKKHAGTDGSAILSLNVFLNLTANQYAELLWYTDQPTYCSINTIPSGTGPTRPASPAVIATITRI